MDKTAALAALSALAQDTRLEVFRLLVQAGEQGLVAGDIGRRLDLRANTLSTNLMLLSHAGLVKSQREGRSIRYFAKMEGMRSLLAFLMEDCCGGRPELCQPVIEQIACAC